MAKRKTKTKSTRAKGSALFLVNAGKACNVNGLKRMGTVFVGDADELGYLAVEGGPCTVVGSYDEARKTYRKQAEDLFRREYNMQSTTKLDYEKSVGKQYGDVSGGADVHDPVDEAETDDEG